jgi:hypothetical protein
MHRRVEPTRGAIATNVAYAPFVNARFPIFEPALQETMPIIEDEVKRYGLAGVKRMAR